MGMKKTTILFLFCLIAVTEAFSCGCDTLAFEEATQWADEIFIGRLIQIREVSTSQGEEGESRTEVWGALFEVEKKWKGSHKRYVEVFQANTSCDFYFTFPNHPYIVYAKETELLDWEESPLVSGLATYLCARNADAFTYNLHGDYAFDDRERLDRKFSKPIQLYGLNFNWKWVGVSLLLFVVGVLVGRRLKKSTSKTG